MRSKSSTTKSSTQQGPGPHPEQGQPVDVGAVAHRLQPLLHAVDARLQLPRRLVALAAHRLHRAPQLQHFIAQPPPQFDGVLQARQRVEAVGEARQAGLVFVAVALEPADGGGYGPHHILDGGVELVEGGFVGAGDFVHLHDHALAHLGDRLRGGVLVEREHELLEALLTVAGQLRGARRDRLVQFPGDLLEGLYHASESRIPALGLIHRPAQRNQRCPPSGQGLTR
jgi:hypothetical protein